MFKSRYTLIFGGSFVFLFLIIVVLWITLSYVNLNREWTLHELEEQVNAGSEQLQFHFGFLRSDLVRVKRYLANNNMQVDEALYSYLDFVRGDHPNAIQAILILDAGGNVVAGTNPSLMQSSFRESEYFKQTQHAPNKVYMSRVIAVSALLRRSEVVTNIFKDPLDLGWVLYTGIYSKGVFKGAVLFVLKAEPFFNRFSWAIAKFISGYGFILQEDGRILFHRDVELRGRFLSDLPDSYDLAEKNLERNGLNIVGRHVIGRQMTVTSEIYLENQKWTLGISSTTSELAQKNLTFIYTLSGLILLLGVIIFGLVFVLIQLGQTKEEVRESEMRFRQFFENEPEYCYMVSPEGVIDDVNNSAVHILGYKKAEIVGKPLATIYAPESLPKMKKLLKKWKKTGKLADEEMVIITKKGDRRTVLLSAGIIKDADGKVMSTISVQKDITDRKQAEEALRESEEKYRELINGMNDTAWVIDFEGKFVDVNNAAVNVLGYSREELLSMGPQDIDTSLDSETIMGLIKGMQTDRLQVFETTHRTKDGKKIPVEIKSSLVIYQGKEAILSIARDITERKQAEKKIRESEEKYRYLVETIRDWIWEVDQNGLFTYVSPRITYLLGYEPEEWLGKRPFDFMPPEESRRVRGLFDQLVANRQPVVNLENTILHKDGRLVVFETNATPFFDPGGEFKGYRGIDRDITDRKKAEEKLQESYKQLQSTFIATVESLAATVEKRDPYTAGHQRRATALSCAIAAEMGLSEERFDGLRMAGLVHDIGKITVPAEILSKPGQLNSTQNEMVKAHPQEGYDILKGIAFPWPVADIVLQHHERMDGSGYPQGLSGAEIMLEARILAVADVVEAMASHRPHRPGHGIEDALEEISQNREVLYDPDVVDICLKLFTEKGFSFNQIQKTTGSPQNI